jgi:ligand-binding sensor domain-containing protein
MSNKNLPAKKLNLKVLWKFILQGKGRCRKASCHSQLNYIWGMYRRSIVVSFLLCFTCICRSQLQPVGNWREHLPYHQAINVLGTSDRIWCATPYSLFSVDPQDNTIERLSKITGLSSTGISAIAADVSTGSIVIGYINSNIDVVKENKVVNINSIENSNIPGDKRIYSIAVYNQLAYCCTGIGIIVIDLQKFEVKDTYVIGGTGNQVKVSAIATDGNFIYASTDEGLKRSQVTATNLADFRVWQTLSGSNGLTAGASQNVVNFQNNIIAQVGDSLFVLQGTNWSFLYTDGWTINNANAGNGKLLLSETQANSGRVVSLTGQGAVDRIIQDAKYTKSPREAVFFQDDYWIADTLAGLSAYTGSSFVSYVPNSPPSIATGAMQAAGNSLWVAAGAVDANWQGTGNKNGVYRFSENSWAYYNASNIPALDSFRDFISVSADPVNESVWAGSFGGGLVNIQPNNAITTFKQNSPLLLPYKVSGSAFDGAGNLWITNYGASQELQVRKTDGNWRSFVIPYGISENAVSQIVIDDVDQKWIVSPKGNGLFCFNHGKDIDNPADDQWKSYQSGQGNGNLPSNNVLCIAKDKNDFIWVGTDVGVGIIQCPEAAFTQQGCQAILPVVQQDAFAGYLFSDEQVQTIAVDGADRKWVGTKNGVWLISPDGSNTIYRFTETNSPLLSNDVRQIAIDGKTGEVFFATALGICSFRSTAIEGTSSNNNILVFPNPVPPGYSGTIAIRGVANNSIVKITELDGRLVYQTRALGGQAVWNGKDYKGRAISTGIYLVLVSDDSRQEKAVTKIVFIQK